MEQMESSQPLMEVKTYATPEEFMEQIKNMKYISQGLDELRSSLTAIIYTSSPCCSPHIPIPLGCILNLSADCGLSSTYNTLVLNNGEAKYLYKNFGRLNFKICATDLMSRFAHLKSYNLSSYDQISSDLGKESVEMLKEDNCVFFGLCSNIFSVSIKPENKTVGFVRYKGILDECCKFSCCTCLCDCSLCKNCCINCKNCCTNCCDLCNIFFDYYYCCDILSSDRQVVYTIFLKRCCISCFPLDCLGSISFVIKNAVGVEVGKIEMRRICCDICGTRGKNSTYTMNFPLDATPEMKLTIINAVISIDMFFFS